MLTHTLHPRIQQKQMHCTAYVLSAFQRKSDDTDVNQNALSTSLICSGVQALVFSTVNVLSNKESG